MPDWKLSLYYRMPSPLRMLGSTMYGYSLRFWRYSTKTAALVEAAIERDTWSEKKWQRWQAERLAFILHRAATQVPYYRNYWQKRRRQGDRGSWDELGNWPTLTKEDIRQNPQLLIADDCNIRYMYRDHTGGTTGTPLNIYQSRKTVQLWYAIYEARIRSWHQVSIHDRWVMLGGQMVTPLEQKTPPFWVRNYGLNQLYLSSFHISKENIRHYVDAINAFAPTHWVVYPSSAAYLASMILEQKLEVHSPKVIITNAEPLSDFQREIISKAFGCPVRKTYGMGEIALAASECQAGNMHYWPDVGAMEVVDRDENETGQLLATGLINPDMPLIRYETGDRGRQEYHKQCQCQRTLPCMDDIEGRNSDLILTPDGRKIFWLNPIFYNLPIQEAQIIQESLTKISIKIIPANGFSPKDELDVIQRAENRLGKDMQVQVVLVKEIPRTKAGKFRAVISHIKQ